MTYKIIQLQKSAAKKNKNKQQNEDRKFQMVDGYNDVGIVLGGVQNVNVVGRERHHFFFSFYDLVSTLFN
jgi:hypothetical protein